MHQSSPKVSTTNLLIWLQNRTASVHFAIKQRKNGDVEGKGGTQRSNPKVMSNPSD